MRKKKIAIIAIILLLLTSGVAMFFIFSGHDEPDDIYIIGIAEAVSITPVSYFDGLEGFQSIFDELYYPIGLSVSESGFVVADSMSDRIQIFGGPSNQRIGMPGRFGLSYRESGAFIDGFREYAMFTKPSGVFLTPDGDIIVADTGNHAIRLITGAFVITIAGDGFSGYHDGVETDARFSYPRAAVMCPRGYIYVADTMNHTIRRINPDGTVNLFAGTPMQHGFNDGALEDAMFFQPSGLYVTAEGVLYVADSANHAIRRIENGIVTTIAGQPGSEIRFSAYTHGGYVDGALSESRFNSPRDIALLPNGYILVADTLNHAIRLITPYETRTVVGSGAAGRFHYSVENMQLTRPQGVATDGSNIFIADTINNRVVTIPITERVLSGRPSRDQMLDNTGLSTNSRFAFRGDIRVFLDNERIDMGRVQPWIRGGSIFLPVRPLLEALGADVVLNETTGNLYIFVGDTVTLLARDTDFFIMRGVMVTTMCELLRLFPYTIEWFPELSLITLYVPQDLRG